VPPHIAVLNGPNLNLLGEREPELYGRASLADIERATRERASELGVECSWIQTNHEGEYVDWCHDALGWADGVIANPGAWTHYSYAIRDALELFDVPIVEVHLSDIEKREEWRRFSVLADLAAKRVLGKGPEGYREALGFIVRQVGAAR